MLLLTLLVFLALCWMFCITVSRLQPIAALRWLRAILLLWVQTPTFVQLLGLLEQLVEIELPDNVLL